MKANENLMALLKEMKGSSGGGGEGIINPFFGSGGGEGGSNK
jgi:hypothetical protein